MANSSRERVNSIESDLTHVNSGKPENYLAQVFDKVVNDDCINVLKNLPDDSINTIITSPPYFNQREYGEKGIGNENRVEDYVNNLVDIFAQCVRVTKKDGSIFFNIGDKYLDSSLMLVPYRFAMEAQKIPEVKLINQITWVKPNPQPRQFQRRLVNSTEPIFHFVKSNSYKYFPNKFMSGNGLDKKDRKAGNNIGKSYFGLIEKSDLTDEQKKMAVAELNEVIEEVKSGKIWSFRMKIKGIHSAAYGGYEGGRKEHIRVKGYTIIRMSDRTMKRDVIEAPILQLKYLGHPAAYPEVIVQECINLTTEKDDIILDPFLGSGTTAAVAKRMGRHFIGIELNKAFCESAAKRINETKVEPDLFEFFC